MSAAQHTPAVAEQAREPATLQDFMQQFDASEAWRAAGASKARITLLEGLLEAAITMPQGFCRDDLIAVADGLDCYEKTTDQHESTTAYAARFIRAALASQSTPPEPGTVEYWTAQAMHWRKQYAELKFPGLTKTVKASQSTPPPAQVAAWECRLVAADGEELRCELVPAKYGPHTGDHGVDGCRWVCRPMSYADGAVQSTPPPESAGLPENETEAMHDAVMEVLYRTGGIPRTRTNELWQAYRRAILAANPTAQPDGGSKA